MTTGLIDRRGHLAQLAAQAVLAATAFVLMSWIPLAIAAVIFGISAIAWPRGALVLRLWEAVADGRLQRWFDDGRPARISTALAAVHFAGLAGVVAAGLDADLMWVGVLAMSAALIVEAVIGACLPCELIVWASRRGFLRFRSPIGETM